MSGPKKSPAREEVPSGTVPARPSSLDSGSHRPLPQVTPSTPFQGGAVAPGERAPAPEWRERPATPHSPGVPTLDLATVPQMAARSAPSPAPAAPPAPRTLPRDMLVTQPGTPGPFLQPAPAPPKVRTAPPVVQHATAAPVFETPSFDALALSEAPGTLVCVVAWFVDAACIAALLVALVAVVEPSAFGELRLVLASRPSRAEWARQFVPVLAAGALLAFIYTAFFAFAFGGASPGRRVGGLKLVDAHGETPGPLRALLRAALAFVSIALGGLGFLLALVTARRQTLHDLLTGTRPVHR